MITYSVLHIHIYVNGVVVDECSETICALPAILLSTLFVLCIPEKKHSQPSHACACFHFHPPLLALVLSCSLCLHCSAVFSSSTAGCVIFRGEKFKQHPRFAVLTLNIPSSTVAVTVLVHLLEENM